MGKGDAARVVADEPSESRREQADHQHDAQAGEEPVAERAMVLVKKKTGRSWKAAVLARTLNARRMQRRTVVGRKWGEEVLKLHHKSAGDMKAHKGLSTVIESQQCKGLDLYKQTDQQYAIEHDLVRLGKDVRKLGLTARMKVEKLQTLQRRIKVMRDRTSEEFLHRPTVDEEVNKHLNHGLRDDTSTEAFRTCVFCGRKMLAYLVNAHMESCQAVEHTKQQQALSAAHTQQTGTGTTPLSPTHTKSNNAPEADAQSQSGNLVCPHCNRKFSGRKVHEKHVKRCKERNKANKQAKITRMSIKEETVPFPPRDLTVAEVGSSYIKLSWKPPIEDGGACVREYEVHMARRKAAKVGHKEMEEVTDLPALSTSRWCMARPVAAHGLTVDGLRADREYVNIKVRARNTAGWSDFCPPVKSVHTEPATGPSAPVNLTVGRVTTTCLHLSWETPVDDGGRSIVDYEISYTQTIKVRNKRTLNGPSQPWVEPSEVCYRIGAVRKSFVMRQLLPDTDYLNIAVRGVNQGGYVGDPATIPVVRTRKPDLLNQLKKELVRARTCGGKFIETDFFTTMPQRELRYFYIKRLEDEMANAEAEGTTDQNQEAEEEEGGVSVDLNVQGARVDDKEEQTRMVQDSIVPKYNTRKTEFAYRIKYLALEIEDAEETRIRCIAERARLSGDMQKMQQRLVDLRAELDRVVTFEGEMLNSAVIHGSDQRWNKAVLVGELRREIGIVSQSISQAKVQTFMGHQLERHSVARREKKTQDLRNRKVALRIFEMAAQRAFKNAGVQVERPVALHSMLLAWRELVEEIKVARARWGNTLMGLRTRLLGAAWYKWKFGRHIFDDEEGEGDRVEVVSKGSALLFQACQHRKELQDRLGDVCLSLRDAMQTTALAHYTRPQQADMLSNANFALMELTSDSCMIEKKMVLGIQGDGYFNAGQYDAAMECYATQIHDIRKAAYLNGGKGIDIKALAITYGRRGRALLAQRSYDAAILNYDCQRLLGLEVDDPKELAEAYFGMAQAYSKVGDYQRSIDLYKTARNQYSQLSDRLGQAACYHGLQHCYNAMHVHDMADTFKAQHQTIIHELPDKLSTGFQRLDGLRTRLIGVTAAESVLVKLELVSGMCLRMRNDVKRIQKQIVDMTADRAKLQKKLDETQQKQRLARAESVRAKEFDGEVFLTRSLGRGEEEAYDIEEFRTRIVDKIAELDELQRAHQGELINAESELKNLSDELDGLKQDLQVEQGALARHINRTRDIRLVALNAANAAVYDVSGQSSGGVEQVAAAEGKNLMIFHLSTGSMQHMFCGDELGRHLGEAQGHLSPITALFFYKHQVYSGSMDTTIQVWDIRQFKRKFVLRGHESTVTSIAVDAFKMVSGSADTNVCIWSPHDGELLMTLPGHRKSVLCMSLDHERFVTGGAEGDVRVWDCKDAAEASKRTRSNSKQMSRGDRNPFRRVRCIKRLQGQKQGITCVEFNQMEVVGGTMDGSILVWWINTGDIMRTFKAHNGPIKCMAFDATKVTTGGVDQVVAVSDLVTGDVVQRLRGHTGHVHAMAFDADKILTGSADCTLRYWRWGKPEDGGGGKDKYHTFDSRDTLAKVAKQYNITVETLMKWNGLTNARGVGVGVKLMVAKGDPGKPTAAEQHADLQKRRQKARAQKILASAGLRDHEKERALRVRKRELRSLLVARRAMAPGSMHTRIYEAVTHGDPLFAFDAHGLIGEEENVFSLANRLTGKAKKMMRGGKGKGKGVGGGGIGDSSSGSLSGTVIASMAGTTSSRSSGSGGKGPKLTQAEKAIATQADELNIEAYEPDQERLAMEVINALVNGVVRWLCMQVATDSLVDTLWEQSILDRMIHIRALHRPMTMREARRRGKRARARRESAAAGAASAALRRAPKAQADVATPRRESVPDDIGGGIGNISGTGGLAEGDVGRVGTGADGGSGGEGNLVVGATQQGPSTTALPPTSPKRASVRFSDNAGSSTHATATHTNKTTSVELEEAVSVAVRVDDGSGGGGRDVSALTSPTHAGTTRIPMPPTPQPGEAPPQADLTADTHTPTQRVITLPPVSPTAGGQKGRVEGGQAPPTMLSFFKRMSTSRAIEVLTALPTTTPQRPQLPLSPVPYTQGSTAPSPTQPSSPITQPPPPHSPSPMQPLSPTRTHRPVAPTTTAVESSNKRRGIIYVSVKPRADGSGGEDDVRRRSSRYRGRVGPRTPVLEDKVVSRLVGPTTVSVARRYDGKKMKWVGEEEDEVGGDERIVRALWKAPRHDLVGAGGIGARMRRSRDVGERIEKALGDYRAEQAAATCGGGEGWDAAKDGARGGGDAANDGARGGGGGGGGDGSGGCGDDKRANHGGGRGTNEVAKQDDVGHGRGGKAGENRSVNR